MPAKRVPPRTMPDRWEDSADVVVVGYGYAGAVAAIEAHDAGASVLILEKMPDPGGISITSGGNVRIVDDAEQGFQHLKATNDGTTPDSVLRALAVGMQQMPAYFDKIAKASSAVVDRRQADGNYPFPGTKTFGYVSIKEIPGFDAAAAYPFVSSYVPIHRAAGVRLFRVIEDNLRQRGIRLLLSTPALRLITDEAGEIRGLTAERDGTVIRIRARRAVVLACGGFEANPEMQRQHWQEKPVLNAAYMGNTGDGIVMAQDVGAALWHMWHYHGVYGFKHPDPSYPFGIRPKRLPDWIARGGGARRRHGAMDHRRPRRPEVHERVSALYPGHVLAGDGDLRSAVHELSAYPVLSGDGRAGPRRLPDRVADLQRPALQVRMEREDVARPRGPHPAQGQLGRRASRRRWGSRRMSWRARSPTGTRPVMAGVTACMAAQRPRWCG